MPKEYTIKNKVKIEYKDDGIFRYTFLPKAEIDLYCVKEMVRAGDEMSAGMAKTANLVDTSSVAFISNDVRNYLAKQVRPQLQGVAVVINSKIQSGLANLYLKFSKPIVKTKIFDSVQEAESWLKALLK